MTASDAQLPLPPVEMRKLVGTTDPADFDNPTGAPPFPGIDPSLYWAIFDFGCGCGRLARRLIQMSNRPDSYLGVDLHRGMIEWCRTNLTPAAPSFRFEHHDVRNPVLNPEAEQDVAMLPAPEAFYSLVVAHSVFTHLLEWQTEHYLRECARILAPHGVVISTWFLFDKIDFPMMGPNDNALYVRPDDPTAAVVHDRIWLERTLDDAGLKPIRIEQPVIHGHQWRILLAHAGADQARVHVATGDTRGHGATKPPEPPADADQIGL